MASTSTSRRRQDRGRLALQLLVAVLLIGVGGLAGGLIANAINAPSSTPSASSNTTSSACPITRVAEDDLRSVVTISARTSSTASTGSGEVIRSDGYIVTNNHVIANVANGGGSIEVRFSDGSSASATIVGRDPLTDVAVIKENASRPLMPISLGSSTSVRVGEQVIALGAPLGLSSTVTSGIVSALDRTVEVPGESSQAALLIDAIQTDAAINPGNSGGALVNCAGQLIGIPSAGATVPSASGESSGGSIGLGFALPIDLVKTESDELIATGKVVHSYLGIDAEPLSVNATPQAGEANGLLVTSVVAGGPAAHAGIRTGDILVSVDRRELSSTDQLVALTLAKRPGDKLDLNGVRNGQSFSTTVILGVQP